MKLNIAVIFGGESVEHEISIITAIQAMEHIDSEKYNIIPVYIAKNLTWYYGGMFKYIDTFNNYNLIEKYGTKVHLINKSGRYILQTTGIFKREVAEVHLAFPMVHGASCEDGTIQGFLTQIGVPYIGNSIYPSVICQDKVYSKELLENNEIPITKYVWFTENEYLNNKDSLFKKISHLEYPLIIKPACLGSSVGIEVIKQKEELDSTIKRVLNFDKKIVIEQMCKGVEFNISILRTCDKYLTSAIEQIECNQDFRAYKDKCFKDNDENDTIKRVYPANISDKLKEEIITLAKKTFEIIFDTGFCRIDFLYDGKKLYVNEINSIPNCFSHHLWEEANISYKELFNIMIKDCTKLKNKKDNLTLTLDGSILKNLTTKDIRELK